MRRLTFVFFALSISAFAPELVLAQETSQGCGVSPAPPSSTIEVDGRKRSVTIVLPDGYQPDAPHALIFAFHGRTNDHAQARRYFGLEDAASLPTIHVYPAGLPDESGRYTWWAYGESPANLRDFSLFDALLDHVATAYCVDLEQVYLVGHSLGATFANSLGCARAELIRGLISVAGGINPGECTDEIAAVLIHNPDDEAVPLSEGERARDVLLNGAVPEERPAERRIGEFTCLQYRGGQDALYWCPHHQDRTSGGRYYPHLWPDGTAQVVADMIRRFAEGRDLKS